MNDIYNDIQAALEKSTDATVTGPIAERIVWAKMIDSMMMLLGGADRRGGAHRTCRRGQHAVPVGDRTHPRIGHPARHRHDSRPAATLLAVEALLISLVSGIAGVLLGTLFGWLGAYVVFSLYGTVAFPFEWGINGIVLAVAAVAALLASIAPARSPVSHLPAERSKYPRLLRRSQKLRR